MKRMIDTREIGCMPVEYGWKTGYGAAYDTYGRFDDAVIG